MEKTRYIKLPVKVTTHKSPRGRVTGYTARYGDVECLAPSSDGAVELLGRMLERIADEHPEPVVMLQDDRNGDPHAWVAYRDVLGNWGYAHFRPMVGASGLTRYTGGTYGGTCTRSDTVESMQQHFEQVNAVEAATVATVADEPQIAHVICTSCEGRGWCVGECHPQEVCGGCGGRGTVPVSQPGAGVVG